MSECKVNESPMCCCVDVGSIIDNSDCSVDFSQIYSTQEQAEDTLRYLISKARAAESELCTIMSEINEVSQGFQLIARFDFSCQAETMIFELSMRNI